MRKLTRLAGARRWGSGAVALLLVGVVLVALGVLVVLVVPPAGRPAGAAKSAGSITLYSGQHVQTTESLVAAFERKTGITVDLRSDDEDVLADQIVTEGSHSPADVFYTENSPPLQFLASKHLFAPVAASTLGRTPAKYDSPDGKWVGVSARVSVLVYNTTLVKASQLPTSAMQLAQPRWKGKLALAPAETDFQPIVTAVARAHGQSATLRWLEALKANATDHVYPDNEAVTDEVNRGQAAIGIINQYYWYRERAQLGASHMRSKIAFFAPHDVGYVTDVSGAAILRSSTHQAAAQRFLAFLTSAQGQEIIAHGDSFEYPVASGVTTAQPETPFRLLTPDPITIAELGTGAEAITLLQEAQLL
jgi:iron(III) transport system substrate-binding protein